MLTNPCSNVFRGQ